LIDRHRFPPGAPSFPGFDTGFSFTTNNYFFDLRTEVSWFQYRWLVIPAVGRVVIYVPREILLQIGLKDPPLSADPVSAQITTCDQAMSGSQGHVQLFSEVLNRESLLGRCFRYWHVLCLAVKVQESSDGAKKGDPLFDAVDSMG
jgi:hypothetical protein